MAVYRFRVTFEDYEDVHRDIEIKASQTFEDFHKAVQSAIGFDNKHLASFFISDDHWRKGQEITLSDKVQEEDGEEDHRRKKPKRIMKQCKLASFIEDPHQKFVYVYDPAASWSFYVELIKILEDDAKASYPRCVKTNGVAPKQYKSAKLPPPEEEDDEPRKEKEQIFTSEEGYEGQNEEGDDLSFGEDGEESDEIASEFENNENPENSEEYQ